MGKSFDSHFLRKETFVRTDEETGKRVTQKHWACGEVMTSDFYKAAAEGKEPTCSKCSAAWAKSLLKRHPGLRLEKAELGRWSDLRSLYAVHDGNDLVGYASIKSGWGGTWSLAAVGIFEDKPHRGMDLSLRFHSKEAALLAIPGLRAEGKLPTWDEVRAEREALTAKRKAERAEAAAKAKRESEELALTIETLGKLAENTARLSNLERNAVLDAIQRLTGRSSV